MKPCRRAARNIKAWSNVSSGAAPTVMKRRDAGIRRVSDLKRDTVVTTKNIAALR
jgi:hypothetical protein